MLSGILISIIIAIVEHITKVCHKTNNGDVQLRKNHYHHDYHFHGKKFLEEFKNHASNLPMEHLQEILKCTQDQLQILIEKRQKEYIVRKEISPPTTGKP